MRFKKKEYDPCPYLIYETAVDLEWRSMTLVEEDVVNHGWSQE